MSTPEPTSENIPDTPTPAPSGAEAPATPPLLPVFSADAERQQLMAQVHSGANWFYWIVGLSFINSLMHLANLDFGFAIGLGVTIILDVLASKAQAAGKAIAFAFSFIPLGFYALMGWLGMRGKVWPFVVGGIFYLIDSLIFIFAKDWIGIALHAYVLYVLFKSFGAALALKRLPVPETNPAATAPTSPNTSSFDL